MVNLPDLLEEMVNLLGLLEELVNLPGLLEELTGGVAGDFFSHSL